MLRFLLAAVLGFVISVPVWAGGSDDGHVIELSLTLDKSTQSNLPKSLLDGDEVVTRLSADGAFGSAPAIESDYSHYYIPKQKITVLGLDLVYFDYEYETEFLGCCVN